MAGLAIDIAEQLTRISAMTIFELRGDWRRLHRMSPPMRLSRALLVRGIAYKLQERSYGGLSKAVVRKLEQGSAAPSSHGDEKPLPVISLKPGTRLVREWRGVTHMVLVHFRRRRVARPALSFPLHRRSEDHRRPVVGSSLLRSSPSTIGLHCRHGLKSWRGLLRHDLHRLFAARSTRANHLTRVSNRSLILSMPSGRPVTPISSVSVTPDGLPLGRCMMMEACLAAPWSAPPSSGF
jgi:hypothetical protein